MVEAILITRTTGTGQDEDAFRPQDLEGVQSWTDITARAVGDSALAPRLVVVQVQVADGEAAALRADNRFYVVGWRRVDEEGNELASSWDDAVPATERNAVLTRLTNWGGDRTKMEGHWPAGMARRQVALKLRQYLRDRG